MQLGYQLQPSFKMSLLHQINLNASDLQSGLLMDANNTLHVIADPFKISPVHDKIIGSSSIIPVAVTLSLLLLSANVPSVASVLTQVKGKLRRETYRGCQYRHWDPLLGLDIIMKSSIAIFNGTYLEMTRGLIERYGGSVHTVVYLFFGKPAIVTMEPENIKAILSTKFQDFIHGEDRTQALKPLFGHGIFNVNGATWKVGGLGTQP